MWSGNFFRFGKSGRGSATGDDNPAPDETPPPLPESIINAQARGQVYICDLPGDIDPARKLLKRYSGIRTKDIDGHIHAIRDKLWEFYPFVCVGHFRFLSLQFTSDPHYKDAVKRLQAPNSDATFLDVGCCVGQVLRQIVVDGVDSRRLYGVDIEEGFVQAGYDLFKDKNKLKSTFIIGDLLKGEEDGEGDESLMALNGKMNIIHSMSFFHLFGWDTQVKAAVRIMRFLKPDDPNVMIFGRHVGSSQPGGGAGKFLHDAETWQRLWDEVGERTGTDWRTEVEFLDKTDISMGGLEGGVRRMRFAVFRA